MDRDFWHGLDFSKAQGMTVSELLSASLSAHESAKPVAGRPRDLSKVAEAMRMRVQAAELDPDFTDPAWKDRKASHADLMAFYRGLLAFYSGVDWPEPVPPIEPVPVEPDKEADLKAALSECLDVIAGEFDSKVLAEGKPEDEGVPGVYARGKALLDG